MLLTIATCFIWRKNEIYLDIMVGFGFFKSKKKTNQSFYKTHPRMFWGALIFLVAVLVLVFASSFLTQNKSSKTFTAIVAMGPISGATVNVYELKDDGSKGNLIQTLTSDASGKIQFNYPAEIPKRVIVESSGGTYTDEVTGMQTQLSSNDVINAVLPAGIRQVAVTPFTNMAASLAKTWMQQGVSADEAVIRANTAVAQQYQLQSILQLNPSAANDPNAMNAASLEEKKYSALLAGLSQEAHNMNVRPILLAQALATDWSDGILDGKVNGNAITVNDLSGNALQLTVNSGISDLQASSNAFLASAQDATKLKQIYISLNPVQADASFAITTAALPYWESGKQSAYTITAAGGKTPYVWSLKQGSSLPDGFSLSKDGIISGVSSLPMGTTKTISPPFTFVVTDSSSPPNTREIQLRITVVQTPPTISAHHVTCMVKKYCNENVATANGGTPPYYYKSDPFGFGNPPMGMTINLNGALVGITRMQGDHQVFGICVVDSVGASDCDGTYVDVQPNPEPSAQYSNLTLVWSGSGGGSLNWNPGSEAKDCGNGEDGNYRCILSFKDGASVTLTQTPHDDSHFSSWSGACNGNEGCTVTMDGDKTVTASFDTNEERWKGTITGTIPESGCAFCDNGALSVSLTFSFKSISNLVAALKNSSLPFTGTGVLSGTSSVGRQPTPNSDCGCSLSGGSVTNIPIEVSAYIGDYGVNQGEQTIWVATANYTYPLVMGTLTHYCPGDTTPHDAKEYGLTLHPTSITGTKITGNLEASSNKNAGSFTLTKQ